MDMDGMLLYAKFRNSIINSHRFIFSDLMEGNELLRILKESSSRLEKKISSGRNFYRARIVTDSMKKNSPENFGQGGTDFHSLNEKEIGAPPPQFAIPGRFNPDHIPYLYVADREYCAVAETKPEIGSWVAVGTCHLTEDIKCLSFVDWPSTHFNAGEKDPIEYLNYAFGQAIVDPLEYLPMQVIAEYIRNMGFDAIAYSSSQTKGGINYLFFDPDICEFTSSIEYKIDGIRYYGYSFREAKKLEFPKY
jgi:hypothetical protein